MRMPKSKLLQRITLHCEIEGECWIWAGPTSSGKYPIPLTSINKKRVSVRRAILMSKGVELAPSQPSRATCGNRMCVCPKHAVASTRSALRSESWAKGAYGSISRSVKISTAKRANSKIGSIEVAREIRANTHKETQAEQAKRYGVTQRVIMMIRSHQVWKEYTANPFALLISANDSARRRA